MLPGRRPAQSASMTLLNDCQVVFDRAGATLQDQLRESSMLKPTILFAAQNEYLRELIISFFAGQIVDVVEVSCLPDVFKCYEDLHLDLMILESPWINGVDTLGIAEQVRSRDKCFPIILVTTRGSEALAVSALRIGLKDYFKLPISPQEFIAAVNRCLPNARSVTQAVVQSDKQAFIGESAHMRKIKDYVRKVAVVDSHVLITGETGTGKELTANSIHQHSTRRGKPFIAVNCAAIPDGLLESELFGYEKGAFTGAHSAYFGKLKQADGGTVFFDEIGDMSPYAQAKILRAIESKEVYPLGGKCGVPLDIRIIAATNQELDVMVSSRDFRQDLYFRLNVARIQLPPVRERKEDIPDLLGYFLGVFNERFGRGLSGFTPEAMAILQAYPWPGNIRELKNMLEGIFIDPPDDWIGVEDLPVIMSRIVPDKDLYEHNERERLLAILSSVNWNKSKAAQQLQWSRMTLYRKMSKYQIGNAEAEDYERERLK